MKNKKFLALALAGAMTLSIAAPALAADLPEGWTPADGARTTGPWYAEAVDYVQDKGLMTGTDLGFEPEVVLTTASVLQTLYNREGRPGAAQEEGQQWYADAAAWAKDNGIAELTEDADVTRGETKAILDAYCGVKYIDGAALMQGNEDGDMMEDKTLTRAEFATILMRLDTLEPFAAAETVFIDVPEQDGIPAHTIPAIVTIPAGEGKFPAVVMLHGTGSNKHEAGGGYDMAAPAMAKAGIATIRFDFMGIDESEASYTDYCFTSANIDAKAAADYMAGLEKVDGEKLAVLGWSQGGTNALLAAAAYPETFKAVITWAGSVTGKTDSDSFKEQYAIAKKDGFYVQEYDWREPLHVGLRWYEENMKTDKLAETAKIEAPILAIQGMKDTSVTPDNAEKIVEVAKNGATRAYFIEDCDHTFNVFSGDYTAINEAIQAGIDFVKEVFGQEQVPADEAVAER